MRELAQKVPRIPKTTTRSIEKDKFLWDFIGRLVGLVLWIVDEASKVFVRFGDALVQLGY